MENFRKPENIINMGNDVGSFALILAGQKTIKSMLAKIISLSECKSESEIIASYSQHEKVSAQIYSEIYQSPTRKLNRHK